MDTITSVQFANGPDAVTGFICLNAVSKRLSLSLSIWFASGGWLVCRCLPVLVAGGGCRREERVLVDIGQFAVGLALLLACWLSDVGRRLCLPRSAACPNQVLCFGRHES